MAEYFGDPDYDFEHLAGDVRKMGEIIGKKLEDGAEQFARDRIIETIRMNEDEMFVGDLLDAIAKINGLESVAPTWYTLEEMQSEGLVAIYISDGDRYTVSVAPSVK